MRLSAQTLQPMRNMDSDFTLINESKCNILIIRADNRHITKSHVRHTLQGFFNIGIACQCVRMGYHDIHDAHIIYIFTYIRLVNG